jgi:hypothetical protein
MWPNHKVPCGTPNLAKVGWSKNLLLPLQDSSFETSFIGNVLTTTRWPPRPICFLFIHVVVNLFEFYVAGFGDNP